MSGTINWRRVALPAGNPDADHVYVGIDSADNMLYLKDSAGVVTKYPTLADLANYIELEDGANYFNGLTLDAVSSDVSSNGSVITMAFEKQGGGDIRYVLNGIVNTQDTTPALSITLTPGTDSVPVLNYVYFDDTLGLQVSTTGFPNGVNEVKIATVFIQSAATVQTDGVLKHQQWNDHFEDTEGIGGHSHVTHWIRNQHATWVKGVVGSNTITVNVGSPDNVTFATTEGLILQLHRQTFAALDMSTGDNLYVVNDNASPYTSTTDINTILTDSAGTTMSGKRFNLVLWGVASEHTDDTKFFVNLPSSSDSKDADAISDVFGYANYDIPVEFRGSAFLICRMTLRHQTTSGGTWTELAQEDLRGKAPGNVVAGSSGATSPAGVDTAVQYNEGGAFGGKSTFAYDYTNDRLGIGTATPATQVDLRSANDVEVRFERTSGAQGVLKSTSTLARFGTESAHEAAIRTNAIDRVRVLSGGDVGIGISPTEKFHVDGDMRADNLFASATGSKTAPNFGFTGDTDTGIYWAASGDMGISVNGSDAVRVLESVSNGGNISVGGLIATTSNAIPLWVRRDQAAGVQFRLDNANNTAGAYTAIILTTSIGANENSGGLYGFSGASTTASLSGRMAVWSVDKGVSLIASLSTGYIGFYVGGTAEANKWMYVDNDEVGIDAAVIMMTSLPTSDPSNTGQLWNNSGVLTVS